MHEHWLFEPPSLMCSPTADIFARIFKMKKLITTLAMATTLIAAPAFAQSTTAPSRNDVTVGGKNIGQDPDSNVRLQLRRDYGSEGF